MEGQAQPLFYALNDMIVCKLTVKQHIMMHLMSAALQNTSDKLLISNIPIIVKSVSILADGIIKEGGN